MPPNSETCKSQGFLIDFFHQNFFVASYFLPVEKSLRSVPMHCKLPFWPETMPRHGQKFLELTKLAARLQGDKITRLSSPQK